MEGAPRGSAEALVATAGIYARMRHPQYVGFVLVMFGFLLQWPTLLTLAMFPVLVVMYVRLARHEEQDVLREFCDDYRRYMARGPGFFPKFQQPADLTKSQS